VKSLVLASNNKGKVREFNTLLSDVGFEVFPQGHFNIPSVEETGLTFVENAILKARAACQATNLPALADDSGIEIDALNGAPGIYSARFAGEQATDEQNNQLLLEKLKETPKEQRTARYQCVLVYMRHALDPTPLICQGTWEGTILFEPRGNNGFGYDPLFYVAEHNCSAAELSPEIKNTLSHRGQALRLLHEQLLLKNK
jgi:XTP/dITP diphosphohydrolase